MQISQVNYPALKSSPQYERVQQLLGGRAGRNPIRSFCISFDKQTMCTSNSLPCHAGGLFSFELAAGVEAADIFLDVSLLAAEAQCCVLSSRMLCFCNFTTVLVVQSLEFAVNAPSLGSVETLITRPSCTSHAGLTEAELKVLLTSTGLQLSTRLSSRLSSSKRNFVQAAGISEGLIRVAIGVEGTEDLLADFAQGLKKACGSVKRPC